MSVRLFAMNSRIPPMPEWAYNIQLAYVTWWYTHPIIWWGAVGVFLAAYIMLTILRKRFR